MLTRKAFMPIQRLLRRLFLIDLKPRDLVGLRKIRKIRRAEIGSYVLLKNLWEFSDLHFEFID